MLKKSFFSALTTIALIFYNADAVHNCDVISQPKLIQSMYLEARKAPNDDAKKTIIYKKLTELFADLFILNPDKKKEAGDFVYQTLSNSSDRNPPDSRWIPSFTPGHRYGSPEALSFFSDFSERIVCILSFLFTVNREIPRAHLGFFFSNILSWTGVARAGVAMLNNPNIDYLDKKSKELFGLIHNVEGTFTQLTEPWNFHNVQLRLLNYLRGEPPISGEKTVIEEFPFAFICSNGRVGHSLVMASYTALPDFVRLFSSAKLLMTDTNPEPPESFSDDIKRFVYSLSWATTFKRGQASVMLWIVRGMCKMLGYELETPAAPDDAYDFIKKTVAPDYNDEFLTETFDFLKTIYKHPDIFALLMYRRDLFLNKYPHFIFSKSEQPTSLPTWSFDYAVPQYLFPPKLHLSHFSPATIDSFLEECGRQDSVDSVILRGLRDRPSTLFCSILPKLANDFPNLKTLDMSHLFMLREPFNFKLVPCALEKLETLVMTKSKIDLFFLYSMLGYAPNLQNVDLSSSTIITSIPGMPSFPHLKKLELLKLPLNTYERFYSQNINFFSAKRIDLSDCTFTLKHLVPLLKRYISRSEKTDEFVFSINPVIRRSDADKFVLKIKKYNRTFSFDPDNNMLTISKFSGEPLPDISTVFQINEGSLIARSTTIDFSSF